MNLRILLATTCLAIASIGVAHAESVADLNRDSDQAIRMLVNSNPTAAVVAQKAHGILVFPSIIKAGLIFGGAYGEGEMKHGAVVDGYYNSFTGSWGLQAGAQSYGYVVFLMNDKAIDYVRESHGWEIGVGPTVVLVNEGVAKNLSTTTLQDDAYAFIFDQKGLMAGISIEGTKISRIKTP
jgi:lipid-binding SYLF domain-containing protein